MPPLSEILFGTSQNKESKRIRRLLQAGKLRKIAPRLYTLNLADPPATILRDNLYDVLGGLFPGAILSHRTALDGKPTEGWEVFLTYRYPRTVRLPGIVVRLIKGPGPAEGDKPFMGRLFIASEARAFLENLQRTRRLGTTPKTVPRKELEERLDRILRIRGEQALHSLRDNARRASEETGMLREFKELDRLIGALLRTRPAGGLTSDVAAARAAGAPFDPDRVRLFQALFAGLRGAVLPDRAEPDPAPETLRNLAFFDAYFSNYIEGTRFEVDEAREIVFEGKITGARPKDAHDVLGTFRLVSDVSEMTRLPSGGGAFLALMTARHEVLLAGRPEAGPGRFKTTVNRAGETVFVAPELVRGTLLKGFEFHKALDLPLAKAIYMMFLVSEVHPFSDGNGRLARVMMNAELVAAGLRRILIPTVYRDDYLGALRVLSRQGRPQPYITMLDRAQEFSAGIDFADFASARRSLKEANAFKEPGEGVLTFPR